MTTQRELNPSQNDDQRFYRAIQDVCAGIDTDTVIDILCRHIASHVAVYVPENERPRALRQIDAYIRQCVRELSAALDAVKNGARSVELSGQKIKINVVPDDAPASTKGRPL